MERKSVDPASRGAAGAGSKGGVDRRAPPTRCAVVTPHFTKRAARGAEERRSPEARLEEAVGLALAIELEVVYRALIPISDIKPATYLGSGKVEEVAEVVSAEEIGLVFVDAALSPVHSAIWNGPGPRRLWTAPL